MGKRYVIFYHRQKLLSVFLAVLATLFVSSSAWAYAWSWSIDNDLNTFTGTESTTSTSISGTITRLNNGFNQFTVVSSSGSEAPAPGYEFFPVEVVGFYLLIPPLLTSETQMIVSVVAGSCPVSTTNYNWVFAGWASSSNMTSSSQAAFGQFSWNVSTNKASITSIYNVSNYQVPSWFPSSPLVLDSSPCLSGSSEVAGPVGTDRRGQLYLSSGAGFIFQTEANKVILGVPEQAIPAVSSVAGLYAAYDIVYNPSASISNRIKPMRLVITQNGTVLGNKLDSVTGNTKDAGYGDLFLSIDSLNDPADGIFKGTLTRGSDSSQVACINYTTTAPQNMVMCSGQDESTNTLPKNLIMVQQTIPSTGGPLTCDSGSFGGTCTISSAKTLSDGQFLTAQNLTVASGGSLTVTGTASLEVVGNITIQTGGSINGDFGKMMAYHWTIENGASFNGNLHWGNFALLTVDSGGVLSASGRGEAGGTLGGNGSGSCPGIGSVVGNDGASGGCHGGVSGAGESSSAVFTTYGVKALPQTKGSGGGSGQGNTAGGAGGGVLNLRVSQTATINGTVSADGANGANGTSSGTVDGAGGGAGGSIFLKATTLSGSGSFSARGGNGGLDGGASSCGGGGSGGRISILYTNMSLALPNSNTLVDGGLGDATNCGVATTATNGASGTKNWNPPVSDLVELTNTNLVARYFLDEAASGQTPTTAYDASSNAINLTHAYNSGNMSYVTSTYGRGLDFIPSDGSSSAKASVVVGSGPAYLNGDNRATLEAVIELESCPDAPSHFVFLGSGTNNGAFSIGCSGTAIVVYSQNTLRISHSIGLWSTLGRAIVHAVYDSTQGTAANRVRLYINGQLASTSTVSQPTSNQTLSMTTSDLLVVGNNATGTQAPEGKISYAAVYDGALSSTVAGSHAERLNANDDGSLVIVALSSTVSESTSLSAIPMTATFSEAVTGFTASDISVTNGTVSGFSGSGAVYTFNITVPSNTVTVNVAAGVATNSGGIGNTAAIPFTFDYVGVPVSTTISSSEPSGTSADPIPFTVTFSESVLGFTASDIVVSSGTISGFSGSGTTYTFNLNSPSTGTLTLTVPAVSATSGAGVDNLEGTLSMNYGGRRRGAGLRALYNFNNGSGNLISDESGVLPLSSMIIHNTGNATWGSGTLTTTGDAEIVMNGTSKILTECENTDEFTIEAWVTPSNITNTGTDKYILDLAGISGSTYDPFSLQNRTGNDLAFEVSTYDDNSGTTYPVTANNYLTTSLTHIAVTFEGTRATGNTNTKTLYVNGTSQGTNSGNQSTTTYSPLYNWNYYQYAPYKLELGGNANATGNTFLGQYHQVAIYCKKLDSNEISLHYNLGASASTEPVPDQRGELVELNLNDPSGATSFRDLSGNRATVTCSGGNCPVSGGLGILGGRATFDGVNDFITSNQGFKADFPYTVSAWIRTTASQAGGIVFAGATADDRNFDLSMNSDGNIELSFFTTATGGSNGVALTSADTFNDGNWHYVVAVRDGARTGRIFVDSILQAEDNNNSGTGTNLSGSTFYVGRNGQTNAYFMGDIDEVQAFSRALSQREVYDDYRKIKEITGSADTFPLTYGAAELWIDASDSANVITTAGKISQINDKSGNFRHLEQQDSSKRPSLLSLGINEMPVIDFDGSNDVLINTDGLVSNQPTTIFMVLRPESMTGTHVLFDGGTSGRHTIQLQSSQAYMEASSGGTPGSGAATLLSQSNHVLAARFNSGSGDMWLNGIQKITSQTIGADALNGIMLGASSTQTNFFDGYIGEVIVYSKALTNNQISEISTALINKWNTNSPLSFPDVSWWLDGADANSVVLDTSNRVQTWYDKSGQGRNISQSTTSLRPTYAFGAGNGLNAVTFDRFDDRFPMDSSLVSGGAYTAFVVAAVDIEQTWGLFFGRYQGGQGGFYFGHYVGTAPTYHLSQYVEYNPGVVTNSTSSNLAYAGNSKEYRVYELHFSTSTNQGRVFLDGTQQSTFTGTNLASYSNMWLGGFGFYNGSGYSVNGELAEVVFFDRTMGPGDERTRIYNYLKNKWGAR